MSFSAMLAWSRASFANRITLFAITLTAAVALFVGVVAAGILAWAVKARVDAELEAQMQLNASLIERRMREDLLQVGAIAKNSFVINGLTDSVGRDAYLAPFLGEHELLRSGQVRLALCDVLGSRVIAMPREGGIQSCEKSWLKAATKGEPVLEADGDGDAAVLRYRVPVFLAISRTYEAVVVAEMNFKRYVAAIDIGASNRAAELMLGSHLVWRSSRELPYWSISTQRAIRVPDFAVDAQKAPLTLRLSESGVALWTPFFALLGALLGATVLGIGASIVLARRLAQKQVAPLRALAALAVEAADGKRVELRGEMLAPNEIGQLAGSVKLMGDRLQQQAAGLEQTVEARTRELREARIEAERASAAKGAFLANMSHELRTPMNAVIGLADLARKESERAKVDDYLGKIYESARSLLGLLNDVLDLSRVEAGKLRIDNAPFQPLELWGKLRTLGEVQADANGVQVHFAFDEAIPHWLRGDPLRLSQIANNLIANAVKFAPGGRVDVALSVARMRDGICELLLSVRDNGIGIPAERLSNLFTPFDQLDSSTTRRFGGTGLGLAITYSLLQLMGGRIEVESRPGAGSTFTVIVPLETTQAPAIEEPSDVVSEPAPFEGRRVLLAEDNPVNQLVACATLQKLGLHVDTVADGVAAVEAVMQLQGHYDLVLMDMQMPRMDGIEATRLLRGHYSARVLPIIALTANAFDTDRQRCLGAGMNDFVAKPLIVDDLRRVLRRWVV